MYVTKEAIEEVRRSNDLVQVIRSRGVELKRKGRNYVGRCPFHEDRTPSLVVSPEKQLWNCLGACAASGQKSGGDVITFAMRKDGVNFAEALRRLAVREPPRGDGDAHSSKRMTTECRDTVCHFETTRQFIAMTRS